MKDILGQAIHDHYHKSANHKLWINNQYGPKEEMPIDVYFRDEDDMPDIEWLAMNECRGSVLDIGAGAGSHALVLQQRGFDCTALDISPLACDVMKLRKVNKVIKGDIFVYNECKYDTLLLLMNGIGLTGTLENLKVFLQHIKLLLNPGGKSYLIHQISLIYMKMACRKKVITVSYFINMNTIAKKPTGSVGYILMKKHLSPSLQKLALIWRYYWRMNLNST
ncbi:class I SAM-dependent methyltransferase [Mucilaginibacter sp. P25]|uniref:class I SAM-dependent methyltransferase n=1 Tax=unclassified Mucilaginibacter TaxID=2617802 RepID=UPI003D676FA0